MKTVKTRTRKVTPHVFDEDGTVLAYWVGPITTIYTDGSSETEDKSFSIKWVPNDNTTET